MNITNTIIIATKAIFTNKLRSFLTMLGIIIGVSSVVLLISIGQGLQSYLIEQFESLGSNNIFVFPGNILSDGAFNQESQAIALANSQLKLEDYQKIKRLTNYVDYASPMNTQNHQVSFQKKEQFVTIIAMNHEGGNLLNLELAQGRYFERLEEDRSEKVVVMGHRIAEELFDQVDPIGKKIKIGSQTFKVIGVIKQMGQGLSGDSFDTHIIIPLKTAFKSFDSQSIIEIIVKIKSKEKMPAAKKAIEKVMLKRLDADEFSVIDQNEILEMINDILGMLTFALGGIAAISLLVGGIGIMNIMLVSVTERTREIGLRKALGATPNQILLQFLIEAAALSILGGLIGLGLAVAGALAIKPYFPAKITSLSVLLAFGVSFMVGVVFGAAPARRASKLSPIEALRYE